MKRLALLIALLTAFAVGTSAQTLLVNTYKPTAGGNYKAYPSTVDLVGDLNYKAGFVLKPEGWVKFNIGGKWESLSFVLGHHKNWNPYGDSLYEKDPCIVTVLADGVKICDEVVRLESVPKFFTLNIKGVKELAFRILQGPRHAAFGDVALWKAGEKPRQLSNVITSPAKTIELVKDLKPYALGAEGMTGMGIIGSEKMKSGQINGATYNHGLASSVDMALVGESIASAHFFLRKQYRKLSFIVGPLNNSSHGEGWITVKADDKIIYEEEMRHDATAKQVVLDINNCDKLTFETQRIEGKLLCGLVKIMVYPEGAEIKEIKEGDAPADPRLKTLPDVTKLVSQIKPYAVGSALEKQLYDGSSDYLTFSMGGTKFSEGFILYETANFWDENLVSYAVFDLGNEFDYLRFTVGYVGKSWTMENDCLKVWADDELILQERLLATSPNKEFILPLKKCRKLRFENVGQGAIEGVAAFGIADAVVYRGENTSVTPFSHPKPDCPHNIDLIDLGKPYIHYVASNKSSRERTFHDGSTKKEYFELDGQRIYKGFMLQTSSHYSLDAGIFAGSSNAAGAIAGSVAAGVAFVPIGASVGGAVIGSTLAGAAALIALAAGGTKVENSCAAFNTYGEYNSLTFTVACMATAFGGKANNYPETLMIGVNGEPVQELSLYESMKPHTVTIPIEGCEQLMFWLANTDGNSGEFLFYDLKLTKDKLAPDVPATARHSKAKVRKMTWDSPDKLSFEYKKPQSSGDKGVDEYLSAVSSLYSQLNRQMDLAVIDYEIHNFYLQTNAGQICKAVRLMPIGGGEDSVLNPAKRIPSTYNEASFRYGELKKLRHKIADINIMKANASLGLVNLGFGAIEYGKHIKAAGQVVKECSEVLKLMEEQKAAEMDILADILNNAIDIDSKKSTEKTIFCPLSKGEVVPEDAGLMAVDIFYTDED